MIVGFFSVRSKQENKIKIITSGCVKSEYRNQGIATSLLGYVLSNIHNEGRWRIGCITPNPVLLPSAMEPLTSVFGMGTGMTAPPWSPAKRGKLGVKESCDPLRDASRLEAKSEKISYKKIDTGFSPEVSEADIKDGLLEFYQNLMGKLGPDEEWILFCKYEPKFDNTIRKEIRE